VRRIPASEEDEESEDDVTSPRTPQRKSPKKKITAEGTVMTPAGRRSARLIRKKEE